MDTLEPLGTRILVRRILVRRVAEKDRTKGGIVIPDTAKKKPTEGIIVAVGAGRRMEDGKFHPLDVQVGDKVLFETWSGNAVTVGGEELATLYEDDVICKILPTS
jgi:chaperonin GroES